MAKIQIDGYSLTLEDLINVARKDYDIVIKEQAIERIKNSRDIIDQIVEDEKTVYGVNTGFGSLSNVLISKEDTKQLQENLIRSHAAGFGDPLTEDIVRALMLIRINSLIKGYSGIRLSTVECLVDMLNKGVHPYIPEKGSLGASGDLAPLAHMVLPMIGLGKAYYRGELFEGKDAMAAAGISPIALSSKEGLALINGTSVLTAIGAVALYDSMVLAKYADIISALSFESFQGIIDAFDERLHVIRPHAGQIKTAANIRHLTKQSKYITKQGQLRVQDPYSFRCIPQVHGASKDGLAYIKEKVEIEINAVTDNPVVTLEGDVISGGNFHGEIMAQVFDYLAIVTAEIANISERRLERLINHSLSGNPSFLVPHPGVNSGFMIAQYAAAALVSENKVLAHPASVDSIPSSENQEDIVSMGTISARKAASIAENVRRVLATELMVAAQAIDIKAYGESKIKDPANKLGLGTGLLYELFRKEVAFIEYDKDVLMFDELEKASHFISKQKNIEAVENAIGQHLLD